MAKGDPMIKGWILAGVLLLVAGYANAAEWRLGVQGGANFSSLHGDTPPKVGFTTHTGGILGAVAEFRIAKDALLSLQPMLLQRGSGTEISVSGQNEKVEGPEIELNYVAVPVLVKIHANNGRTFVTGGVNLGFLLDAELKADGIDEDVQTDLQNFDLAADIGVGVQFPLGSSLLYLELRYEQSVLNLSDTGRTIEEDDILPARFRSSGFQFLAGFLWSLGGGS